MRTARPASYLTLLFALGSGAYAQEVQFIDLTAAPQRIDLRYPPPVALPSGHGMAGGGGGGSVGDCAADIRDPHAAGVYLDLRGKEINPAQPFEAEFRFVNTGRMPINIPVSPNLSDLQPADPSVPFTYLDLALAVRVGAGATAYVELYGAADHSGTTRVLRPGEWIRVKANLKLNPPPAACDALTLTPGFWMHSNRFRATSSGSWEEANGICINEIPIAPPPTTVLCVQPHGSGSQ